MNWRLQIIIHDLIGHPLAGFLWLFDTKPTDDLGHWLHGVTMYECLQCHRRFDDSECPACGWGFCRLED